MKVALKIVIERAKNAEHIIIVGAGKRGRELLARLHENGIDTVRGFFDNDKRLIGSTIQGIQIMEPHMIVDDGHLYIIAIDSSKARKEVYAQLQGAGIGKGCICIYHHKIDRDLLSHLDEKYYQAVLQEMYYERFGKQIDWDAPVTYNEKINWEKLNVKDERRTRLADKYLVRQWVKEQIGEKYLTKLYGVWDKAEEIDLDSLPDAFVLKVNNGSSRNFIVKDRSKIDRKAICQQLDEWRNDNFAYESLELHYRDIVPKIICEEYLEGVADDLYDYDIFCFHGEPMYIWCIKESHKPDCCASFYDKDWKMQPFSYGYPKDPVVAPRPKDLEEMLRLSRILSKDFEHVRIDWYDLPDGRVIFCEMTFSSWSGLEHWEPEAYDTVFGRLI